MVAYSVKNKRRVLNNAVETFIRNNEDRRRCHFCQFRLIINDHNLPVSLTGAAASAISGDVDLTDMRRAQEVERRSEVFE